jgi:hypothetical protein
MARLTLSPSASQALRRDEPARVIESVAYFANSLPIFTEIYLQKLLLASRLAGQSQWIIQAARSGWHELSS